MALRTAYVGLILFQLFFGGSSLAGDTFTNPIIASGADPWVIQHNGWYYLSQSRGRGVSVTRAKNPTELGQHGWTEAWKPPAGHPYSQNIWAPELHRIGDRWFIYVAADDGRNENHRMYVLESAATHPLTPFQLRGELELPDDRWAIDGTVLTISNQLYFMWSGWEGTSNVDQRIYIARMATPTKSTGERVCISKPEHPWERHGNPWVNEGPQALWNGAKLFVIYSASGSWGDDYCLGQLEFIGGDPMRAENWRKKPQPVFSRTSAVFGPGHASFVKSPDGTEDWMFYHAAQERGSGWRRNIRAQPFRWNIDGSPNFGTPVAPGTPIPLPSGTLVETPAIEPALN